MRIAIVGTGLIGASLALAAQRRGDDVVGWDPDPDALAAAVARGAVRPAGSLEDAVDGVELAVVAAPIAQLPAMVATVLAASGEATVTDVGSTKAAVVRGRRGLAALRRRSSDLRLGDARCRERDRGPVRGRDLVPHAGDPTPTRRGTDSSTASSPTSARLPWRSTPTRTTASSR